MKSRKSIMKLQRHRTILVAIPELIEFVNCESKRIYKKTVILQNIGMQIARFKIESRPSKSAFDICIESVEKNGKNIAAGMHAKLVVQYRCDGLSEPEETLMIHVYNGKSIIVKMRTFRNPPILRVFSSSTSFEYVTLSSDLAIEKLSTETKTFLTQVYTNSIKSRSALKNNIVHININFKMCFVGELIIISKILKNIGGKARFFIMSEFDWRFMKIQDLMITNKLIIPPFAFWPSYFVLQTDEQLILYTYFYPTSNGIQTDQLYIISDNCSLKTIEVVGNGVMFEPHLIQIDQRCVKYQWYRTKLNEFITIRYLDLGTGCFNDVLTTCFTVISTCQLNLHYRWEINNKIVYPPEYINLFVKKDFCPSQINIKPSCGIFQPNSTTPFKILAYLNNIAPGQYRSNLRLIIEDIPFAAIAEKHNFSFEDSKLKQRLCENLIDIVFQNIEIRIKCISRFIKINHNLSNRSEFKNVEDLLNLSLSNSTDFHQNSLFSKNHLQYNIEELYDSKQDTFCYFTQEYGICDCNKIFRNNTAILRPGSPIYVGVEVEFYLVIRNQSSKRLLYWWGNILGQDRTKINIMFERKYNFILPYSSDVIKLILLPLETGNISSMYITCEFNDKRPLILSIECTIQSLCIAFYFPLVCEKNMSLLNQFRIEWNANDYVSIWDHKTKRIKLLAEKLNKEKFLHSTVLSNNSINSLKKTNVIESSCPGEDESLRYNNEQKKTKINNIKTSFYCMDLIDDNWNKETLLDNIDYSQKLKLLAYSNFYHEFVKKHFRYVPLIIELYIVSGISERKRIFLRNESPIASSFFLNIKNFMNRSSIGNKDENEFNEHKLEVVLTVEPLNGMIEPNEMMFFDIIAKSNTWGIYTDCITINIDLLPPYTFWIRIINNNLPISYPIYRKPTKIPKIRFNIFTSGISTKHRKLLLKNTSTIPLYLHWYCFTIAEDTEMKPFNTILDMFSPFIDINEYLLGQNDFIKEIENFFSCSLNLDVSKNNLSNDNKSNNTNNYNPSNTFKIIKNKNSSFNMNSSTSTNIDDLSNDIANNKIQDTEFQFSLIPYYGEITNDLFTIIPKELFLPPKEKRYVHIYVNSEKLKKNTDKIRFYKACGFIRIPPIFKFNDNIFFRKDGYDLPPTEVYLECDIRKPILLVHSCKSQRTFKFHVKDFLQYKKKELKVNKTILFNNHNEEIVIVIFEINEPFQIKCISTEREVFNSKCITIHPGENVKIEIKCILNEKWKENTMENNSTKISPCTTINRILSIICRNRIIQTVAVYIKIKFPSLKLSTIHLNFGNVLVGDTKTLMFRVQNLSNRSQHFEIKRNNSKNVFSIYPSKALLSSQTFKNTNVIQITVRFTPKNPKILNETIEIISEIDGLIYICTLKGIGYIERKV